MLLFLLTYKYCLYKALKGLDWIFKVAYKDLMDNLNISSHVLCKHVEMIKKGICISKGVHKNEPKYEHTSGRTPKKGERVNATFLPYNLDVENQKLEFLKPLRKIFPLFLKIFHSYKLSWGGEGGGGVL